MKEICEGCGTEYDITDYNYAFCPECGLKAYWPGKYSAYYPED